jgi:4-hydroxy-tetrahydrodipicolinate synthase
VALHGIVTALVTPFREDERLDCSAWQKIIDSQIAAGVDGLFVGGSTGEFYAQDFEERTVAMRFVRQAAAGRVPVYANVGCITTRDTVRLALAAQSEGIDAVAVITPFYIKPSQDELADHYIEICRAVHLPVLAYNFPMHGGVEILPETVARIAARCENLAGVKDSSGSMERLLGYRAASSRPDFAVFIGPENLSLAGLQAGCAGVVSGSANIAPRLFVDLYRAVREGRIAEAERLQALVDRLCGCLLLHTFPSVIKMAVATAGRCRRPVGDVPPEIRTRLDEALATLREAGYAVPASQSVTAS